ncbi:MAG: hypothetical protein BWX88_01044 [Planctomycetes bacterium ADurb.Bin126]|nr:MAG: hypothetical protein BWX88_01044 [Planctomycetes bacterium ADurb.Bin126]HOD82311.1 hypothetical protein [Phycisphaerae bacterium]HQL74886.1 hypothetical protein [Phycisphaerae bacterium]
MKVRGLALVVVAVAAATMPAADAPPAPAPSPVLLTHAGVSLVLPDGFAICCPTGRHEVFRAVQVVAGQPRRTLSLSVVPVNGKVAAPQVAEQAAVQMGQHAQAEVLKKTPMAVAGIEGAAHLLRYRRDEQPQMAARVFFLREIQESKRKVCYVLEVEAQADREADILPVLGQVIKSLKLIPLQHPAAPGADDLSDNTCRDEAGGYALRPPRLWRLTRPHSDSRQAHAGVQLGLVDLLENGAEIYSASVMLADVPDKVDAEAYARNAIQAVGKAAAADQATARLLSQGAAELGGAQGYQFMVERRAKDAPADAPAVLIAQRSVCAPGPGVKRRCYTLILVCQGQTPKAAAQTMDTLAAGFSLLAPPAATTAPATAPATAPSTAPASQPASRPATRPSTRPA